MRYYERWWQDNLDTRMGDFGAWLSNSDDASRVALFKFVEAQGIKSVLECGPGLYTDYHRFFSAQEDVKYRAIDVTPRLVALGRGLGVNVRRGSIEEIPAKDGSHELVYCRHVLEHLPDYKLAISEMLRVASRFAVAICWRISDSSAEDQIEYNTVADVPNTYHNTYSRGAMSAWLDSLGVRYAWTGTRDRILVIEK